MTLVRYVRARPQQRIAVISPHRIPNTHYLLVDCVRWLSKCAPNQKHKEFRHTSNVKNANEHNSDLKVVTISVGEFSYYICVRVGLYGTYRCNSVSTRLYYAIYSFIHRWTQALMCITILAIKKQQRIHMLWALHQHPCVRECTIYARMKLHHSISKSLTEHTHTHIRKIYGIYVFVSGT